jgi:catalase
MQMHVPRGRVNYEPSSLQTDTPREAPEGFRSFAQPADDGAKGRIRAESFADHYSQARLFYRSQTVCEQAHIASALVFELSKVETGDVRERIIGHLRHIDIDLAKRVANGLGLKTLPAAAPTAVKPQDMPLSPALQIIGKMKSTLEGRQIGILIDDGSDGVTIRALRKAAEDAGATVKIVAPKVGGAELANGKKLPADGQLAGTPSILFDAVAVVLSNTAGKTLAKEAAAVDWIRDAYGHLKAIAFDAGAQALLQAGNITKDAGVVDAADIKTFIKAAKTRQWQREPKVRTLA